MACGLFSRVSRTTSPNEQGVAAAPPRSWSWIDVPESICADGSPTGLGINPSPGARRLLLYFQGGGACWSYETCFGAIPIAVHLDGFDQDDFESTITDIYLSALIFDRSDERNPFRDDHQVFVPYCTGDVHAGDREVLLEGSGRSRTIHFRGRANLRAYLERLRAAFPDVEQVVVLGSSAGGYGAALSWPLVAGSFPEARVDAIDDSGPLIAPEGETWQTWQQSWGLWLPDECAGCRSSVDAYVGYIGEHMEGRGRFGYVGFRQDLLMSAYTGWSPSEYTDRIDAFLTRLDSYPAAGYFVLDGQFHTMLILATEHFGAPDELRLWQWIGAMVDGPVEGPSAATAPTAGQRPADSPE